MKKYKVTIWLVIPYQSYNEKPKTKKVFFEVEAQSKTLAIKTAEDLNDSPWSIWNYKAEEII